jgi:twitching motility protein PilT
MDSSEQFLFHFKLAMSLRVAYSGNSWMSYFDLLVNTPQATAVLQNNDLSGLEKMMRESDKDSGMRTINQSLINLIIRRKIDLKKGFELSPAPSELDSMLKQIGI